MCENLRTLGFDYDGTFAEYLEIPAQAFAMGNVLRVGEAVPTPAAVLAEPTACCVNGQEFLQIGPEDTVFIFGSGYIGCMHAELALGKQARRVILRAPGQRVSRSQSDGCLPRENDPAVLHGSHPQPAACLDTSALSDFLREDPSIYRLRRWSASITWLC
jgi:hypothetical protein